MSQKKLRAIAVVLPQFHPIPENDQWWGKGFTEWTNVVKAKPRFKGHYQPHLPADLGFYDMRLLDTLKDQADLAQQHHIQGFCYYHYWFNGKRLLETPLNRIRENEQINMPFMLCWANENWSRRWDGQDKEVLMKQEYSEQDHRDHAAYLAQNEFKDKRYILVDGKPFFLFYNPQIIPDLQNTIKIWREEVKKAGFEDIYLGAVKTIDYEIINAQKVGFDVVIEWQPDWKNLNIVPSFWDRIKNKFGIGETYRSISYEEVVERMLKKPLPSEKHFHCIMPSWDNSARRKQNAFLITDSNPDKYQNWLSEVCKKSKVYENDENFIFINAWNEWAEGNHLEPDLKWGRAYLEKTREVLKNYL
jgi:lipopolysaccharide biosynthesis protein